MPDLAVHPPGTPLQQVLQAWPAYLAYVVSFLTIGAAWLAHTALTDRFTRSDPIFLQINLLVLLVVAFLPFPTRPVTDTLHNDGAERVAVTVVCWSSRPLWCGRQKIARSRYRGCTGSRGAGLIVPLHLLLFGPTYFVIERVSAATFTQPLTRADALYFTVTRSATRGRAGPRASPGAEQTPHTLTRQAGQPFPLAAKVLTRGRAALPAGDQLPPQHDPEHAPNGEDGPPYRESIPAGRKGPSPDGGWRPPDI